MEWLLQNAAVATLLAAVVYLICRTGKLSPAGCHLLWLVVLVKLITPPIPLWTLPESWSTSRLASDTPTTRPASHSSANTKPTPKPENYVVRSETLVAEVPETAVEHPSGTTASNTLDTAAAVENPDLRSRLGQLGWPTLLAQAWLWGSGIVVGLMLIRIARMRRFLRWTSDAPTSLSQLVDEEARRLGVRPPRIRMSTHIASPQLWSVGRATLLWPECVSFSDDPDSWQGVIVHELAHLKRRDHWVGWLEIVAGCCWWWNPVLWFVRHHLREQAELACDAWVTNAFPENRRAYADAILNVCSVQSRPAGAPAVGIANSARRFLERRIRMIFNDRVPFQRSKGLLLCVAILGLLVLPGWAEPYRKEATDSATKPPRNVDPVGAPQNPQVSGDPAAGNLQPPAANKPVRSKTPTRNYPLIGSATVKPPRTPGGPIQLQIRKKKSLPRRHKPGEPTRKGGQPGPEGHSPRADQPSTKTPGGPDMGSGGGYPRAKSRVIATRTITLQRTTYLLPAGRAKALQAFLKQNVKADVLDISVGRDPSGRTSQPATGPAGSSDPASTIPLPRSVIIVTTTPDIQKVIGALIGVMRRDEIPKDRAMNYGPEPGGDTKTSHTDQFNFAAGTRR